MTSNLNIKKNMQNQGIVLPKINNQNSNGDTKLLMHQNYQNIEGSHSKSLGSSIVGI